MAQTVTTILAQQWSYFFEPFCEGELDCSFMCISIETISDIFEFLQPAIHAVVVVLNLTPYRNAAVCISSFISKISYMSFVGGALSSK
jgi:hypothetical protein